jgi:hypothetical protein
MNFGKTKVVFLPLRTDRPYRVEPAYETSFSAQRFRAVESAIRRNRMSEIDQTDLPAGIDTPVTGITYCAPGRR